MQQSGDAKRDSDQRAFLDENPGRQRHGAYRHDRHVEGTEGRRQSPGIFASQPIARETRNDPAADQRDQQHDDRDADPNAVVGRAVEMSFEMEGGIAGQQQRDQHDDLEIAPVLAGQDFPGGGGNDQREKADVDQQRQPAIRSSAEIVTATRPATHTRTSASSGLPWIGSCPVQFGIAVKRKPVITAGR